MKNRMTCHKVYGVWEYEKEIEDLNKRSIEGWQLEKGGCFHSVFIRNENIRYIYQLDYAPRLDDKERYTSFFEEQGWEYLNSTFNGWHYFRKEYHEGMAEEEMEIYSDKESLMEMQGRFERLMRVCAVICSVMAVAYTVLTIRSGGNISLLLETVCFYLGVMVFGIALYNVKRRQKGLKEILAANYVTLMWMYMILFLLAAIFVVF